MASSTYSLAHWASRHRRSILFLLLVAALGGLVSAFGLPVALFPNVAFPRVRLTLDAGDRPAEMMVAQVTRPAEQAVRSVPGVRDVRSTTSRGSAELSITFDWGRDMNMAELQIESAISRILPSLPANTAFSARKMNPTVFPVAAYSLTSDKIDQMTLRDIAQYQLVPLLSAVNGVASVDVQGGEVREFRVAADPALLASYGMTMDELAKALTATNVLSVVGRLEDRHKLLLAVADSRLRTIGDIGNTVVRSSANGTVLLSDVARIYQAPAPNYTIVTADGRRAVILQVFQQPDGNTVQIVKGVAAALAAYQSKLPKGIEIHNWYDQSQLILASAASVRDAILIGVVLAGLVLLGFLRSLKITAIVLIFVPAVLATTVLVLSVAGMSFNIMTLGGMAAAIGLIIDDAIVMIEQIVRRLSHNGEDRHDSIRAAVTEFLSPLAGSSSATIIIFLPLAFLTGVTGAFFKALSLTMASALVISFLAAWFVIPLLADYFVTRRDAEIEQAGPVFSKVLARYEELFRKVRARPLLAAGAVAALFTVGLFAYFQVGSGFMPAMDEGGFILDYIAPPGTSLADTDRMLNEVEKIIRATPEVQTYSRRTGTQLGGGLTEANTGDYFIRLKPLPRRDIEDVMADIQHRVEEKVPGLEIETAQLMEDLIGDLTAVPQPIEIELFGDDAASLRKLAPRVADLIGKIPGVTEIKDGVVLAGDGLAIDVDPVRAGIEGLTPADVAAQMETYLAGNVATEVQRGERAIGVRLWVPARVRGSIHDLERVLIAAPDGHKVALSRIATLHVLTGQPEIDRDNLKTMVAVTARIEGRDMGSTVSDVRQALDASGLMTGDTYYELGGLYRQQQIAFRGLMVVIVAAFFLVFALLLYLYERFDFALAIIAMPLTAMPAVFIGLWLTGIELNISAMMGMTMVVGIVTEVAIFYFSEYEMLLKAGRGAEALFEAGINRFRPIAMTTLAAILALLPLALGLGQGSAMQQPLAVAIISGLIVQMPLVLIVMPILAERLGHLRLKYRS
ncbi:MAG: efflux RND transporter permease subunit [Alphaproteobacteria bacterium]|nr:efflux RND transporter permease subunit [Alphaproteobacteria bacterium]MDE2011505.1 efflux RND transporter permease subunit [Alphaproteobacteria bacterium]MDE2071896.1 efflux RND transporter permease subunit [Alphaproteobacteria bacterium]